MFFWSLRQRKGNRGSDEVGIGQGLAAKRNLVGVKFDQSFKGPIREKH